MLAEVSAKLRKAAGLPKKPTGVVANNGNGNGKVRARSTGSRTPSAVGAHPSGGAPATRGATQVTATPANTPKLGDAMAELTHLDEKLAEVLGLAQAAQTATKRVATLARQEKDTELLELLERMGDEAAKVEQRCDDAAGTREGMKTAIAAKARETKAEVNGFMKTYLEDAEALDGLEFLSMAEAGELAHWEILATLNETANDKDIADAVEVRAAATAVPCRRHPQAVTAPGRRGGSLRTCLAARALADRCTLRSQPIPGRRAVGHRRYPLSVRLKPVNARH